MALLSYLPRDEVESIVGAIKDDPALDGIPVCERAEAMGLEAVHFASYGKLTFSAVRKIRDFVKTREVDILHTHGYKTDIVGMLAVCNTQCKIVATPHGWSTDAGFKLQIYEHLDRLAFYFIDAVAPLSADLYDGLARQPGLKRKLHLIRNGVDISEIDSVSAAPPETLPAWNDDDFVIGYIGQLIPRKGLDTLIRAFHNLGIKNGKLWIIGDGPQQAQLESLVGDLGESERIRLLGFREDRIELLKRFQCFVLPSSLEGIPRCLMEAMAARIPVVATNIPGCTDLVEDGETGLLFEFGDVTGLETALRKLLSDPVFRARVANSGEQLVRDEYSAAAMARNYVALYSDLMGSVRSSKSGESGSER